MDIRALKQVMIVLGPPPVILPYWWWLAVAVPLGGVVIEKILKTRIAGCEAGKED